MQRPADVMKSLAGHCSLENVPSQFFTPEAKGWFAFLPVNTSQNEQPHISPKFLSVHISPFFDSSFPMQISHHHELLQDFVRQGQHKARDQVGRKPVAAGMYRSVSVFVGNQNILQFFEVHPAAA